MVATVIVIILFILLPYICGFIENLIATHSANRIYQRNSSNEHHQKSYNNGLLNDFTPYGLQLKNHAQIDIILDYFSAK